MIKPQVYHDSRGSFFESYNKRLFEACIGASVDFVQDNHSVSKKGALRGLHFQHGPYAQSKLVRVVKGEILDVVVDLRTNSDTFGQHFKIVLSEHENIMLFVPKGMAHGFVTLSEEAVFLYKCDAYYRKEKEGGIVYNDPDLDIDWEFPEDQLIISTKDRNLPSLKELKL